MGYTVKQLDLVDLTSWTKFNPMRYIDPDKPDVAIMRLVTNIMDNTNGSTPKEHQTNDFWTKSERSLLTALTAFVYYLPDDILKDCLNIEAGQTLNAVADMRDLLEASEQDETKESQVDAVARTATEIYEETRAESARLTSKIAFDPAHPFVEHFKFIKQFEDDTAIARQTIPAPAQLYAELFRPENIASVHEFYGDTQRDYDELADDNAKASMV